MKYLVSALLLLAPTVTWADNHPKNIIMVVGDGMGPGYTTAYRYFADDKNFPLTKEIWQPVIQGYQTGHR